MESAAPTTYVQASQDWTTLQDVCIVLPFLVCPHQYSRYILWTSSQSIACCCRRARYADPRWKTDKSQVRYAQKGLFQIDVSMHHAMLADAIASYQKAAGPDATGRFTQPAFTAFQMLFMHPHSSCVSFKRAGLQPGFRSTLVHDVQSLCTGGIYTILLFTLVSCGMVSEAWRIARSCMYGLLSCFLSVTFGCILPSSTNSCKFLSASLFLSSETLPWCIDVHSLQYMQLFSRNPCNCNSFWPCTGTAT